MSSAGKAVFLSYASQDAEAATRICDALRAAGVEVWFDQSELVGGDQWDVKIRQQISSCALFVPVVSASTQARREGYFRIEWRLAGQRTHGMADGTPFLVPVVIDETRDADALVPGEFKAVQWSRLRTDAALAEFVRRVVRLLAGEANPAPPPAPSPAGTAPAAHSPARAGRLLAAVAAIIVLGGAATWWWRARAAAPAGAASVRVPALSASDALVAKARALLDDDPLMTRANVVLAEQLASDAVAQDQSSAEAHAALAWANFLFINERYEDTPARRAALRDHAEKARLLAPDSVRAELAWCGQLAVAGGDAEARTRLQALAARAPGDLTVLRYTAWSLLWRQDDAWGPAGPRDPRILETLRAVSPAGAAYADALTAGRHWVRGEYRQADQVLDRAFATGQPVRLMYLIRLLVLLYGWGDVPAARAFAETIPSKLLLEDVFIAHVSYTWLLSGEYDKALAVLGRTPREMLQEALIFDPTAMLRGDVLAAAGRPAAAAVQWREALRVIDQLLAASPANPRLLQTKAKLLASLGDRPAAATAFALAEELTHPAPGSLEWAGAQEYFVRLGDADGALARLDRLVARDNGRALSSYNFLRLDPLLAAIRADPRAQPILERGARWLAEVKAGGPAGGAADPAADGKSVAVLPFANLSADKDNEFFADGVHEDVITNLAKIRDLKIISRTSVLAYRDTAARNLKKVAAELGVANVLEGSVRRVGSKVRVTAQLIDARTDAHLWAETFDGDTGDIFALQADLAQKIAAQLRATLTPGEKTLIERRPTNDAEAYESYLRARALHQQLGERGTTADFERLVAMYERATARDPAFALAYAQLATVHSIMYWFGYLDPSPARAAKLKEAVDAAVRLAPEAPETHFARGVYLYRVARDWAQALAEFRRAEAGLPNDGQLMFWLAITHRRLGHFTEALTFFERSLAVNPRDYATVQNYTLSLILMRRWDQARAATTRFLEYFPAERTLLLPRAWAEFALSGDRAALARTLEAVPPADNDPAGLVDKYQAALVRGDNGAAEQVLADPRLTLALEYPGNILQNPPSLFRTYVAYLRGDRAGAARNADEALAFYGKGPWNERQRPWAQMRAAQVKAWSGRTDEAVQEAEAAFRDCAAHDIYDACILRESLGVVYLVAGRREEALGVLRELVQTAAYTSPNDIRVHPIWSRLKDDPRFEPILTSARPL